MKVLWIFSSGMFKNGICVSQLDYYKKINKEKITVEVATIEGSSLETIEQYENENCKVHILPDKRKKILAYMRKLKELIQTEKYDIIHTHGSSTLLFVDLMVAKKCGVKVRIAHSRNTSSAHPNLEGIFRVLFNRSYNLALACGKDAGKWLFKNKEFTIFHNGKDFDKYRFNKEIRQEMRDKLNISDKEIAIGHVGVFNKQKNHKFLIEVFDEIYKRNNSTKLYLFGVGPFQKDIKEKVIELGIQNNVVFMDNVNDIEKYLNAMDIMLFPSLFEGLPNVVIEWQISGLPVLMSDKITSECSVCEFVRSLPIDRDVQVWIKEFENMKIFGVDEREKMSNYACGRLIENGFEISENAKSLEKIYENAMEGV